VSQQAFYETVQREQERMEYEQELLAAQAAKREEQRLSALAEKWPGLKSWPGKPVPADILNG
jgi:hypothetical protein